MQDARKEARQSKARQGEAREGKGREGKGRKGKERQEKKGEGRKEGRKGAKSRARKQDSKGVKSAEALRPQNQKLKQNSACMLQAPPFARTITADHAFRLCIRANSNA